jgi:hypothetical protein
VNPFAVLGLPEWPDLEDETVRAAWQAIAAETHPDRADGGNLARYTQACAAFAELNSPWGRSEAYAGLAGQAWRDGRYDDCPGMYPADAWPPDGPPPPGPVPIPVVVVLQPVPLRAILHLIAQVPAQIPDRIRRGHPRRLLARSAVIAAVCVALVAAFPVRPDTGLAVAVLIAFFALTAWDDLAPPPGR